MDLEELFDQNPWWKDKDLIEEDYDILKWKDNKYKWVPDIIEKITLDGFALHILLGARQTGKTTVLKLLIEKILGEKNPKSIFYFSCENLSDYKELLEAMKLYLEFKEDNSIKNSIIMLDEITLPKEWYRAIKSLIDKGMLKNDVIIITGSSSISVKKQVELFPGRRGKGKDLILYPLSFRNFVKVLDSDLIEKIKPIKSIEEIITNATNALLYKKELDKYLEKYMEYGGFPLSVTNLNKNKEEAKRIYLTWVKNAFLKAERSDLIARQIIKVIIETYQTDISWEGASKKIEIKSPKTVSSYIELLKSIFSLNILYNIDISGKKIRFGKNKKIHFRDPLLFEIFEDWVFLGVRDKKAAIAESLVVEHLERMFSERVFFWKNGIEIDAIVLEKNQLHGFEVKWKEKSHSKMPNQIKNFTLVTKKDYSKKPLRIPLSVFLALFDV